MDKVFNECINKVSVVYIEDITAFSTSLDKYIANQKSIFEVLRKTRPQN